MPPCSGRSSGERAQPICSLLVRAQGTPGALLSSATVSKDLLLLYEPLGSKVLPSGLIRSQSFFTLRLVSPGLSRFTLSPWPEPKDSLEIPGVQLFWMPAANEPHDGSEAPGTSLWE